MNTALKIVPLERVCKSCTQSKPLADFHLYGPDRFSWKCKPCHIESERKRQKALWASDPAYRERHNAAGKAYRRGGRIDKVPASIKGSEKQCKVCEAVKPTSEFPLRGNGHRLHTCARCYNDMENLKARVRIRENDEYRARKLAAVRRNLVKRLYGVTVEHVENVLTMQHGRCANRACGCEISFTALKATGKRAVIDHCHKTGKFRALLCDGCNLLLGRMEKSENIVLGLQEYVQKHR